LPPDLPALPALSAITSTGNTSQPGQSVFDWLAKLGEFDPFGSLALFFQTMARAATIAVAFLASVAACLILFKLKLIPKLWRIVASRFLYGTFILFYFSIPPAAAIFFASPGRSAPLCTDIQQHQSCPFVGFTPPPSVLSDDFRWPPSKALSTNSFGCLFGGHDFRPPPPSAFAFGFRPSQTGG
jgi:hypothetical protein